MENKSYLTLSNILLLSSLFITQYIAYGFFADSLIVIWRKNGLSLEELSFIPFLGLFWILRFLWSPYVDKYIANNGGDYKKYLILMQGLLTISIFPLGFFNITDKYSIISLLLIVSFLSASLSIGIDGLSYKILREDERGFGGSLKSVGGIIGYILGGGIFLMIYEYFSWTSTIIIWTIFTSISFCQLLFFKEPTIEVKKTIDKIEWKFFIDYWKPKKSKPWLITLATYSIGIFMAYALIALILVDMGMSLDKIGFIMGIYGSIIGIISSFTIAWFVKRYKHFKVFFILSILQAISILFIFLLLNVDKHSLLIYPLVTGVFACNGAIMPILSTLIMDKMDSSNKYLTTLYSMQIGIYSFFGVIASSASIYFAQTLGYGNIILIAFILALIPIILIWKFFLKGVNHGNAICIKSNI